MENKPQDSGTEKKHQEPDITYICIIIGCSDYDLEKVGKKTGKLKAAIANIKKIRQLIGFSKFESGEIINLMDRPANEIESVLDDTIKEIRSLCHKAGT